MLTVAAAIDLGLGIASLLFSNAVERTVMGPPRRIRQYVEPRVLALLESSRQRRQF